MGSREFKNYLPLRDKSYGEVRKVNLSKEILRDSTPFPNPLSYKDIDQEFHRWVDEEIDISFEGKKVPTMDLFSNQRFSEYMQTWKYTDENKNILLNFKALTRENNPKGGSLNGDIRNIPGERTYLMKRVVAKDKNDREYYIEYRMKQPFTVDLLYKLTIITNKYELINEFNEIVNDKFKAINCYIRPKGHYIPMKLTEISDDSEYNIDDRQFYSQSYNITVMAYIIPEDSFIVEERPKLKFLGFEGDKNKTFVEVEELEIPNTCPENEYYNQPIVVNIGINECETKIKFTLDCDFYVEKFETGNLREHGFLLKVNDEEEIRREEFLLKEGDEVKICKLRRMRLDLPVYIKIFGYEPNVVLNRDDDFPEFVEDKEETLIVDYLPNREEFSEIVTNLDGVVCNDDELYKL